MSDRSPLLDLPYIQPAQAQKHVTHNEALRALDALVQLAVLSRSQASPPAVPNTADRYIVAAGAQGDWTGQEDTLAFYADNAWAFYTPQTGWQAYVLDEDTQTLWDGAQWRQTTQAAADDLNANSGSEHQRGCHQPPERGGRCHPADPRRQRSPVKGQQSR